MNRPAKGGKAEQIQKVMETNNDRNKTRRLKALNRAKEVGDGREGIDAARNIDRLLYLQIRSIFVKFSDRSMMSKSHFVNNIFFVRTTLLPALS